MTCARRATYSCDMETLVRSSEMIGRARSEIAAARLMDRSDVMFEACAQGVLDAALWVIGERSAAPFSGREILHPSRADLIAEQASIEDAQCRPMSLADETYADAVHREIEYLRFGGEPASEGF